MKIVADENIARLGDFFGGPWELYTCPGRDIGPAQVKDADILLVRSVTRVDAALLDGSAVCCVGTATSGVDHIDKEYLLDRGIRLHDAVGANANSVVEYVLCALAALYREHSLHWQQASFGIIGAGHIGGRLARLLQKLGIVHRIHDPLLDPRGEFEGRLVGLEKVMASDVISLHIPLTRDGEHPTWHLFDQDRIDALSPGTVLINSARGDVVDNAALEKRLEAQHDLHVVMDTWEGEPVIRRGLANRVALGTSHIAGYSSAGKVRGTANLRQACADLLGVAKAECGDETLIPLPSPGVVEKDALSHYLLAAYDIREDHRRLQVSLAATDPGSEFDSLRRHYGPRPEFAQCSLKPGKLSQTDRACLEILGFQLCE